MLFSCLFPLNLGCLKIHDVVNYDTTINNNNFLKDPNTRDVCYCYLCYCVTDVIRIQLIANTDSEVKCL